MTQENQADFDKQIVSDWVELRDAYDKNNEYSFHQFVEMEMRNRGDYAGRIATRRNEWRAGIGSSAVSFPVVARALRSNTATSVSTEIKLNLESTVQHPAKTNGVEIAKSLYELWEQRVWTEELETDHAELAQRGGYTAVRVSRDSQYQQLVGHRPTTGRSLQQKAPAQITCRNTGKIFEPKQVGLRNLNENDIGDATPQIAQEMLESGMKEEEVSASYAPKYEIGNETKCPECQAVGSESTNCLSLTREAEIGFDIAVTGTEDIYAIHYKHTVIPSLLHRMDDINAIGFKWKDAGWANHHFLVSTRALRSAFPHLKDKLNGTGREWSIGVKWYYELGKPNLSHGGGSHFQDVRKNFSEVDCVWFQPDYFAGWIAERDHSIKAGDKEIFNIKEGETVQKATMRYFNTKQYTGLKFYFWDKDILTIEPAEHTMEMFYIPWRLNPTCARPNGEERLNKLQNQVTNCFSMGHEIILRDMNSPMLANSRVFEKAHLTKNKPGDVIMSKNDVAEDFDIGNAAKYMESRELPASLLTFTQLLIDVAKEESGVFDEAVGQVDPTNKTASGMKQSLNRSLHHLLPPMKAKKLAKKDGIRLFLRRWQREQPDEAFQMLKGVYEDGVTTQDIADFRALNIDYDIRITEVVGSDVPKNAADMFNLYQIAVSWGLLTAQSPLPLGYRQYIVRNVLGLPIDVENYEADRRLAAARVKRIAYILQRKEAEFGVESMMVEALTQQPDTDGQDIVEPGRDEAGQIQRVINPNVLVAIDMDVQCHIQRTDAHLVLSEYYQNQIKALQVSRQVNEPMILALQAQVDKHEAITGREALLAQTKIKMIDAASSMAANPALLLGAGGGAGEPAPGAAAAGGGSGNGGSHVRDDMPPEAPITQ